MQLVARKKFTCNTLFCNCNSCVASCKKSRTTFYFSQRCETSCKRVTPPCNLKGFLFVIVASQVVRKIASRNMALKYVWNVQCALTNHRRDPYITETIDNEWFPIFHGTNYFCFVLTCKQLLFHSICLQYVL